MTVSIDSREFRSWANDLGGRASLRGFAARRKYRNVLHRYGVLMVEEAMATVPVRTGYLKSTINYSVDTKDIKLALRAEAPYAVYVEHGTSKMEGRKFLTNAWDEHFDNLKNELAEYTIRWARK